MDSCFGQIRIPKERDTNQDPNLLFLYFCPYCIDQIKSYCLVHISHYFLYFFNILYLCLVVNYFPNTSVRCKSMCINGVQMLHAGYSLIRGGRNPALVRIHNLGDYPPVACFVNRANGDVHGSCAMTSWPLGSWRYHIPSWLTKPQLEVNISMNPILLLELRG